MLSPVASLSIIVGNQGETFGQSWIRFGIGASQSIDRFLRVGNQSRWGQWVSNRALGLGPPVACWWPSG